MNAKTATAIAMAVTLVTVGLSAMPYAAASSVDCTDWDYVISDDKNNPNERELQGDFEIGLAEVSNLDGDRRLFVDITDNPSDLTLDVEVFDEANGCASICDFDVTKTDFGTCDLDAPDLGTNQYYVFLEEDSGIDMIKFEIWHEER